MLYSLVVGCILLAALAVSLDLAVLRRPAVPLKSRMMDFGGLAFIALSAYCGLCMFGSLTGLLAL